MPSRKSPSGRNSAKGALDCGVFLPSGTTKTPTSSPTLKDTATVGRAQRAATIALLSSVAQRESARSLHEQTMQLFMQPTVDARAAEALRQQMLAQHDASSKRMLQAMLDASRVLSPEQRKTLGQKMAEMRARHGERDGSSTK